MNKPNITLPIEFKLFRLLPNKSSLNLLFKSMFIKEKFIMSKILLLEEFLLPDLFLSQPQFLTKFLLLEESQFLLEREEEVEDPKSTIIVMLISLDKVLLLQNLQSLQSLQKEMDTKEDTKELLLGFTEKVSMKFHKKPDTLPNQECEDMLITKNHTLQEDLLSEKIKSLK